MSALIVTLVVLFVLLLMAGLAMWYVVSMYNGLIDLEQRVDNSYANIETLLQQRNDEMNGLIEAAKSAMSHEEDVLLQLAEAREQAQQASTPKEQAEADQVVNNAMGNFRMRVEDHPDVQGNQKIGQLMERVSSLESKIADRRSLYNDSVTTWNTRIQQFPHVILAQQLGSEERELFEAEEGARDAPDYQERLNPESAA